MPNDENDAELARAALRSILSDRAAPAAAKAAAARTLAEMAGALRPSEGAGSVASAFEMSRDDLNAELARLDGMMPSQALTRRDIP